MDVQRLTEFGNWIKNNVKNENFCFQLGPVSQGNPRVKVSTINPLFQKEKRLYTHYYINYFHIRVEDYCFNLQKRCVI